MAEQPQGFARRMMAQKLMADARATPNSDSPSFFGRIRPSVQDMADPTRFSDMAGPAYTTGATASLFAPGAGVVDIFGGAPDPMQPGQMLPSFGQNVTQGNYLDAGLQALGGAGDVMMAAGAVIPPALPAATMLGTALKAPRATRVAGQAADAANTLVDDLPTLRFDGTDDIDLEGKNIFPIVADLTAAGGRFEGIDSSKLDAPELLQGGPEFPNLKGSRDAGVVWAVQGKGVGTKKLSKEADYGLVVAMNPDSHRSNATFVNSILGNTLAYVRDGRISPDNLAKLDAFVRTGTDQKQLQKLKNWPGFESPQAAEFVKSLNFEERKRIADVVGSSRGQALGAPNIDKIIRATGDPALLGLNSRDAIMLVKLDKEADLVRLGTEGSLEHNSYDFGIKGEPVARIPVTSARNMFPDFFAQAEAEGKQNVRRAFDLALPVETLTAEKIANIRSLATQSIDSPRQAALTADLLTGTWKSSSTPKNAGGLSPTEFVQALKGSDASSTLTMMELPEVQKKLRGGNFEVFQLGDGEVFFGLEKSYNYDDVYGLTDNPTYVKVEGGPELTGDEVALVSVINNEVGAKGVGKATVLKAIEEGATALDAFAVPSDRFPDGFLPDFYGSFGFEEVGRIDFDPSFYSQTELADLEDYWRSTGWNESAGPPKIVIMKWTGDDGFRADATKRFVKEGRFYAGETATGIFAGAGDLVRAGDGPNLEAAQGGRSVGDPAGNLGGAGLGSGSLAPDRLAAVARELLTLPDAAVENLGIDPSRLTQVRDDLGLFR
jgi:hypothetical protein